MTAMGERPSDALLQAWSEKSGWSQGEAQALAQGEDPESVETIARLRYP